MLSTAEHQVLEFHLLGAFEVAAGGRVAVVGSPKQRALLAMLVVHLNRVVPLDAIVEELWGERLPASASASVQSLVSRLRRSLSDLCPEAGSCLRGREPGYVLEADPAQVDANRFEELFTRGREAVQRGEPEAATEALERALALWRGPALADLSDRRFARLEASRLEEARLAAVEELAEAELTLGHPAKALARLEPHVAEHPLRERAWGQIMVALYRLGRQADALRAYQRIRSILREELGLEPTPSLRRLEQQILLQRPELEEPRPPEPVRPAGRETRPSGTTRRGDTVVFLFTDIEASTHRWEGDEEAMAEDLARHDEIVRGAVEETQGRVFANTGDGLCAAFPTASAALTAALGSQLALLEEEWRSPVALRVRMAIHAGAAEPRGGNYVGPTLNRTARLLSLGWGGQVLCSQAAADLARDHLPAGVALLDLGDHRLADLSRAERVFQVAHPDLPAAFPPLRSPGRRHALPAAVTSFVGRAKEIKEVRGLLGESRLVTLTGVGGGGKTRLALEVAAGVQENFPDGVVLVELGPLSDPALVASMVASALGVLATGPGGTADVLVDRLSEYLQSKRTLIILDNCEHVIEVAAELVHALLPSCPGVTVLATSREILGLPGEVAWRVPPLSLPAPESTSVEDLSGSDAVALFCERARRAQPGFGLSQANAAAVTQVCRRLDGIPLALELAAARIRVLGAQDLARRLHQRFRLLTGGIRTAVPRHQTLIATMDWSYDLLPTAEQVALRRLAVFPGSFDLEAAEAVVGQEEGSASSVELEVLDLLSHLVDKSLVVVDSEGVNVRYRLLETVRDYGAAKLAEAGEPDWARRRHRDFFLALASTHEDPLEPTRKWSSGEWIRQVHADYDSFRTALEWSIAQGDDEAPVQLAAALWRYWWWTRPLEGSDWLERVLAEPTSTLSPERLEALIGSGFLLPRSGRASVQRGEEVLRHALDLALEAGMAKEAARARYFLGELAISRGSPEEAEPLLNAALQAFEAMDAPLSAGWCHHALGWMAMAADDQRRAQDHFEQVSKLARGGGAAELLRVHGMAALAPLAALAGEADRAQLLAKEAVMVARRLPALGFLIMALTRAAETALLSGRQPRATLRELIGHLRDLGAQAWVVETLEMVALVREAEGRPRPAARLLGACRALEEALGEVDRGRVLSGEVSVCRRRIGEALGDQVLAEEETLGHNMTMVEALAYALAQLDATAPAGPLWTEVT
ncbi:MAG TPA: BTAD domain-containing putative transcriptional regulator [Acidimicrobiia bacterium]